MSNILKLNNGGEIPAIGFGTWQILLNSKAKNAVLEALDVGYRLIDTARIYGNEKGVGKAIRESGIPIEEIFVTTKLWNSGNGYEHAIDAFDDSLGRLGLDYVDLYLIHWPARDNRLEAWRALEDIYKSGHAKAIGVSNYEIGHINEILSAGMAVPAVNQIEFHPFIYHEQQAVVEFCQEHGIVVEAYSPLAQARHMNHPTISEIGEKYNRTNSQIMLRWCIQHGTVPIPKSSRPGHIRENFDAFDFEISTKDIKIMDALGD